MSLSQKKIEHVVVLMLENRSFDNLVGWLYDSKKRPPKQNIPQVEGESPSYNGLKPGSFSNPTRLEGAADHVFATKGTSNFFVPTPDPNELFQHMNQQLFGNNIDKSTEGWLPAEGSTATMNGFIADYATAKDSDPTVASTIMQTYSPQQVPVMSQIARSFAISDDYHASCPTQTWPNRSFMHAGTSEGRVNNFPYLPYLAKTIYRVLQDAGVSWRVYSPSHLIPPLTRIQMVDLWDPFLGDHFQSIDRFFDNAQKGRLPAYSFLEPSFIIESGAGGATSEHPPANVKVGDVYLGKIWDALHNSPCWEKTLFIVNFDEHGGCCDHVPPNWTATPPDSDSNPGDQGFRFNRFGVRVPAIAASPWIEEGTVFRASPDPTDPKSIPFDHTSILAMILDWQKIDRSKLPSARVQVAPTFDNTLTRKKPRTDSPKIAPSVIVDADYMPPNTPLTWLSQSIIVADAHYRAATSNGFSPQSRAPKEYVQELLDSITNHQQAVEHFRSLK